MISILGWIGPLCVDYFRHAYVAGTAVALAAGLVGWFVVLRNQVFAGDALSHMAFTGGVSALAVGLGVRTGIYGGTIVLAVVLAILGRRARQSDVTIGITFAWILGLGVLATSIFTRTHATTNSAAAVRVLFGSVLGVSAGTAWITLAVNVAVVVAALALARPLLFSTIDRAVAGASGVPVAVLDIAFLALVAITVAQSTQVVGALLVLGLLATPAATAAQLTASPWRGMAASVAIAVVDVWGGLWLCYVAPSLPPSTAIVLLAFTLYLGAWGYRRVARSRSRRPRPVTSAVTPA